MNGRDDPMMFQRLAWRIAERLPGAGTGRALLVTSARRGEGKSFVADALAAAFGQQNAGNVALVECIESGSRGTAGQTWSDLVDSGNFALEPAAGQLYTRITCGRSQGSTLYRIRGITRALELLRTRFAMVILDGPNLGDCGVLSACTDAGVLVVDAGRTRREIVKASLQSNSLAARKLLGVVLNQKPQFVPRWLYRLAL
jgi:Mrp family chromosome partitioning ATPase